MTARVAANCALLLDLTGERTALPDLLRISLANIALLEAAFDPRELEVIWPVQAAALHLYRPFPRFLNCGQIGQQQLFISQGRVRVDLHRAAGRDIAG